MGFVKLNDKTILHCCEKYRSSLVKMVTCSNAHELQFYFLLLFRQWTFVLFRCVAFLIHGTKAAPNYHLKNRFLLKYY